MIVGRARGAVQKREGDVSPTSSIAMRSLELGTRTQGCEVVKANWVSLAWAADKSFPKESFPNAWSDILQSPAS